MIKSCARCGKEFEIIDPSRNSQKYCSRECYNEVSRVKNSERRQRYRETEHNIVERKSTKEQGKLCKRYGCLYHPNKAAANSCDYTLITGKLRGCACGKDCTCYKRGTAKERKRMQIENAKKSFYGY